MNAFHSVAFYLQQAVMPAGLVPFHPFPIAAEPFSGKNLLAAAVVILLTVLAIVLGGRDRRFLWVGWLYYLVTLAPVAGVLQVGAQASADRYTYLTLLGPGMLFAAAVIWAQSRLDARFSPGALRSAKPMLVILVAALLSLCHLTRKQIRVWRDSVTLWEHVIAHYPDISQTAHTNLGNAYMKVNEPSRALTEYRRALALPPPHALPYDGTGRALLDLGEPDEALKAFKKATELDPAYANAWRNMWFAYRKKGQHDKALEAIQQAVKVKPDFAAAHSELGINCAQLGRFEESERALRRAVELEPDNPRFLVNLATTLRTRGKPDDALELYLRAIQIAPRMPEPHAGLAAIHRAKGNDREARKHEEAVKTLRGGRRPDDAAVFPKP
jgi:tetratricopeptide (TPR) repeat protein